MTAPTVRVPGPLRSGEDLLVTGESAHYLLRVRRVERAAHVRLVAHDGCVAQAQVVDLDETSLTLRLEQVSSSLPRFQQQLVLVASGLRSGGTADVIAACAELGVDVLALTNMHRSVARVDETRLERYERVAADAIRKVGQPRQVALEVHESLAEAVDFHPEAALFVLDEEQGLNWEDVVLPSSGVVLLAVGPEGGLESFERELLKSAGATAVKLRGPAYRARTAALAGVVLLLTSMGRL